MYIHTHTQCNLSRPNSLGTEEKILSGGVSLLGRFHIYSIYREQDLEKNI